MTKLKTVFKTPWDDKLLFACGAAAGIAVAIIVNICI